jgi:hypothetical protein
VKGWDNASFNNSQDDFNTSILEYDDDSMLNNSVMSEKFGSSRPPVAHNYMNESLEEPQLLQRQGGKQDDDNEGDNNDDDDD